MIKNIKKLVPFAGLFILMILFAFTTDGKFVALRNIKVLISQSAITMIAATGTVFVMTHNNLDFSLGGAAALCATFSYMITGGDNLILLFLVSVLIGICCGLLTSLIHIKGRIPAFMAGMCIMFAGRGAAEAFVGRHGMFLNNVSGLSDMKFYLTVFLIVFILEAILYNYTKIGKFQKLIGSNPQAAALSGIAVNKYKTIAFVISGITVGICGFLLMVRLSGATVTTGQNLEIDVLIALSLGGLSMTGGSSSKIRTAVLGTLIYYILSNGLTLWGVPIGMVNIAKAIVFLLTVFISRDRTQKIAV